MAMCKRIQCSFVMEGLPAPPREIFPLLCPVREADWIPGWSANLLWSRSGVAEPGALFTTPGPTGSPWIWHIVEHDAVAGRIRFSVTAPGSHLLDLVLGLEAAGEGARLAWTYTLLALTPEGETFLDAYEEAFRPKMELLERRLRHWLRTGTLLT
ncbi:MAG TPA: hypothetical protein VJ570_08350 [Holophagaceae bacterium]|nr:hypothetical protein [Holophagaceae bacterium]